MHGGRKRKISPSITFLPLIMLEPYSLLSFWDYPEWCGQTKVQLYSLELILNKDLQLSQIPAPESDYSGIEKFALTFNGYEVPNCAEMANSRSAKSLTDLRAALFFEQRRYRHFGHPPEGDDLEYVRSLVQEITVRVGEGDLK
jgi:hypothetical protein